jgi:hypothetical protein
MSGPPFNGPYSICRVELQDESDGVNYITISWGYDTEEEARRSLPKIVKDKGIQMENIAIVKAIFGPDLDQKK